MDIIGAIYQYLVPAMRMAVPVCAIWMLLSYVWNKKVGCFLWGIRYVFLICASAIVLLTNAYSVFFEGVPEHLMYPNLIPIYVTLQDFRIDGKEVTRQVLDNLALFFPFGFLLCGSFPRMHWTWWKIVLICLPFAVVIEGLEFLSGRYMDVDDLLINTTGALLGYGVYKIFKHKMRCVSQFQYFHISRKK
ncbi:MAG: VanZ family protein [Lachnospiraceae bacterium]